MGNCLFGGLGDEEGVVRVVTPNGGVMELCGPVVVGSIVDEFPGHGVFPTADDLFCRPLGHQEELVANGCYYLLPLKGMDAGRMVRQGHARSYSVPRSPQATPYRMSVDYRGAFKRPCREVFARDGVRIGRIGKNGVWKVRLVISTGQLLEILSEEASTEELIESVRAVAKCGKGLRPGGVLGSDHWSLSSSSRNASSKLSELINIIS
ncbi:hypothetical protein MLD38_019146 [Melastoma candidum]|uniref:Uncharacterized protein n=1 Tax=Melastoma candidum TaxID=119954 RepID=A0ACB9QW00_9MYRT|nr:hypothetical protein MLD38_019146 [Melastoma candidum]